MLHVSLEDLLSAQLHNVRCEAELSRALSLYLRAAADLPENFSPRGLAEQIRSLRISIDRRDASIQLAMRRRLLERLDYPCLDGLLDTSDDGDPMP